MNNFEVFKQNLGKYISSSRPINKTKKEAAAEIETSLSKYMAYEDPNKDYSRQSVPLDLLFNLAKRDRLSLKDLVEKIDKINQEVQSTQNNDKIILELSEKIRCTSRTTLLEQLYKIFIETQKKFPKTDLINTDPELWILYMLHNVFILDPEDIVELIYSLTKRNMKNIKNEKIDLSFNKEFQKRALSLYIEIKKKEVK
jgi:hypothetical protein